MDFENATDGELVNRWHSLHLQLLKLGRELLEMTAQHPSYGTLHDFYENTSAQSIKVTEEMEKRNMFIERETLKDEYRQFLKD